MSFGTTLLARDEASGAQLLLFDHFDDRTSEGVAAGARAGMHDDVDGAPRCPFLGMSGAQACS